MARILVVDDHEVVRDGLRSVLADAGHEVVGEADEVTAAVAAAVRLQPDLVLLDLSLRQRSGLEVLAELQRRELPCRVVVLSMSDQPRTVADAVRRFAVGPQMSGDIAVRMREQPEEPIALSLAGVRGLLTDGRATGTILLWMATISGFMTLYFVISWIPKLAVEAAGLPEVFSKYSQISPSPRRTTSSSL